MTYKEFENQVANTFNRMHIVESCDDEFMIEGSEGDVQTILARSFRLMFFVEYSRTQYGYRVFTSTLEYLFMCDESDNLVEALQSFNSIMDKYHVVFNNSPAYEHCRLHIV